MGKGSGICSERPALLMETPSGGIDTAAMEAFAMSLTDDERGALDNYVGLGYMDINRYLRTGTCRYSKTLTHIELIDNMMMRAPLVSQVQVYRAINKWDPSWANDVAYISTSLSLGEAEQFWVDGKLFTLDIPKPVPALYIPSILAGTNNYIEDEQELLIHRGCHIGVQDDDTGVVHPPSKQRLVAMRQR